MYFLNVCSLKCTFPKCIFPKCIFPKVYLSQVYFAKSTRLLSFASLLSSPIIYHNISYTFRGFKNFLKTSWPQYFEFIFEKEGECWFISNDHFKREREGWKLRLERTKINVWVQTQLLYFFEILSLKKKSKVYNWEDALVTVGVSFSQVEVYTISGVGNLCNVHSMFALQKIHPTLQFYGKYGENLILSS